VPDVVSLLCAAPFVYDFYEMPLVAMLHDIYIQYYMHSRLHSVVVVAEQTNEVMTDIRHRATNQGQFRWVSHLRSFHASDHSPLSLPNNPHQPFSFHRTDGPLELARVDTNATLIRELLDRVGPTDTARRCGSRCEESEDLLLHVLAEFALLLACTGVEQAHVDLARGRVEGGGGHRMASRMRRYASCTSRSSTSDERRMRAWASESRIIDSSCRVVAVIRFSAARGSSPTLRSFR